MKHVKNISFRVLFVSVILLSPDINAQNVTIGSGGNVSINSSTLTLSGDWDDSGAFKSTSATVQFDGSSGDQNIKNAETFENITINKSYGNVVLSNNITVNGKLTCISGNLDLNSNSCTLGGGGILREASGSEVTGGTISITTSLSSPSSDNVGGLGAEITSGSNLGATTITRGSAAQTANSNHSVNRYYDISPATDNSLNATFVFHYTPADLNGLAESNLKLFKSTDGGTSWTEEGGTVNTTNHTVTLSGINSFSRWTLGSNSAPLPVELKTFTANVLNSKVKLEWKTVTEVNDYGFNIERQASSSGSSILKNKWIKIGFVKGAGNSNSPKEYSFIDNYPAGGSSFAYRLKQINNSGKYTYSKIMKVKVVPSNYSLSQNYPNPFNPSTTIRYQIPEQGFVSVKVFDALGRDVETLVNKLQQAGNYRIIFNASKLASGVYYYRLHVNRFTKIKKMLVLK